MSAATPGALQHVWPLHVRLIHWALAAAVVYTWIDDSGGKAHRWIGYAAVAVVLLRLTLGCVARQEAARPYLPRHTDIQAHLRDMLTGRVTRVAGHNPLGMSMSWLLWLQVFALGLSGWISRWDRFWGEDLPQDIHAWISVSLQVCVVLHLLGVAVTSFLERQNFVLAMLTGKKHIDA